MLKSKLIICRIGAEAAVCLPSAYMSRVCHVNFTFVFTNMEKFSEKEKTDKLRD